jgi:hypothetical protein
LESFYVGSVLGWQKALIVQWNFLWFTVLSVSWLTFTFLRLTEFNVSSDFRIFPLASAIYYVKEWWQVYVVSFSVLDHLAIPCYEKGTRETPAIISQSFPIAANKEFNFEGTFYFGLCNLQVHFHPLCGFMLYATSH